MGELLREEEDFEGLDFDDMVLLFLAGKVVGGAQRFCCFSGQMDSEFVSRRVVKGDVVLEDGRCCWFKVGGA